MDDLVENSSIPAWIGVTLFKGSQIFHDCFLGVFTEEG
jgi:hypothetical protein